MSARLSAALGPRLLPGGEQGVCWCWAQGQQRAEDTEDVAVAETSNVPLGGGSAVLPVRLPRPGVS